MQAIHSNLRQKEEALAPTEKFLNKSITDTYRLFLYMISLLVKLHEVGEERLEKRSKMLLASDEDRNPSRNFVDHRHLKFFRESEKLQEELKKRKMKPWDLQFQLVNKIYEDLVQQDFYKEFLLLDSLSQKKEARFLSQLYTDVIAPRQDIMDFLEDENITWMDDYPLVNSAMLKFIERTKPQTHPELKLPELVKDESDIKFSLELLRKTVNNQSKLIERIQGKTPNWDTDRIAQLDTVLIMMAQCELLYFPSIPVKVTINEYVEISKDYSSPKSGNFINGILDTLLREFRNQDMIQKVGRGLM